MRGNTVAKPEVIVNDSGLPVATLASYASKTMHSRSRWGKCGVHLHCQ